MASISISVLQFGPTPFQVFNNFIWLGSRETELVLESVLVPAVILIQPNCPLVGFPSVLSTGTAKRKALIHAKKNENY